LIYRCPSLIYRCLSLIYRCPSLIYRCLSLIYRCLSLIYRCLSLIYRCLNLTRMAKTRRRECFTLPARVSLALLTSAGVVALYLVRVNFSVAIVAMVRTASPNTNYTTTTAPHTAFCSTLNQVNRSVSGEEAVDVKLESSGNSSQTNNTAQDFSDTMVLTGTERGLVLGGFFYGYCLTCILGGRLGELYGTKRVFGGAILIGGVLTLFTPLAARSHYVVLMLLRTVIGLSQVRGL
ncbi:Sialin-like 6, partial [Homarus americanus]